MKNWAQGWRRKAPAWPEDPPGLHFSIDDTVTIKAVSSQKSRGFPGSVSQGSSFIKERGHYSWSNPKCLESWVGWAWDGRCAVGQVGYGKTGILGKTEWSKIPLKIISRVGLWGAQPGWERGYILKLREMSMEGEAVAKLWRALAVTGCHS